MKATGLLLLTAVAGFYTKSPVAAQTWTSTGAPSNQWYSIASSADGVRLAVAGDYIPIYTSTNSGVSWMAKNSPVLEWFSIAASAGGIRLVAATPNTNILSVANPGAIYTSTNAGATWALTSAPATNWFAVASSADGATLAAVVGAGADLSPGQPSPGLIYVSTNFGNSWTPTRAPTEFWSCIALSADGRALIAGAANPSTVSPVCFSTDSGNSWVQANLPTNVNWSAVAASADGSKLMAANLPTVIFGPPYVIPGAVYLSPDRGGNLGLKQPPQRPLAGSCVVGGRSQSCGNVATRRRLYFNRFRGDVDAGQCAGSTVLGDRRLRRRKQIGDSD